MMTVNEVSKLTGVSARCLHHYDKIGLLHPTKVTEARYRLYDEKSLERLQLIMLFKEMEFPLKEIKDILDSPNFDKNKAIEQQITLLQLRRDKINELISFAKGINKMSKLNFDVFDTKKIDEYKKQAKKTWGKTDAYMEYEKKSAGKTNAEQQELNVQLMEIFAEFGKIKNENPNSDKAQSLVKKLQNFITENYYTCTDVILLSLGEMYASGDEMTDNIDKYAGIGTAKFASDAIKAKK